MSSLTTDLNLLLICRSQLAGRSELLRSTSREEGGGAVINVASLPAVGEVIADVSDGAASAGQILCSL